MSTLQRIRQLVIDRRDYHATTLDAIDLLLESGCPVVKEQLQVPVVEMPA